MSDRYRPSEAQIETVFSCSSCGREFISHYAPGPCSCGGQYVECGEAYPADPSEWDEERGPDGDWRQRW